MRLEDYFGRGVKLVKSPRAQFVVQVSNEHLEREVDIKDKELNSTTSKLYNIEQKLYSTEAKLTRAEEIILDLRNQLDLEERESKNYQTTINRLAPLEAEVTDQDRLINSQASRITNLTSELEAVKTEHAQAIRSFESLQQQRESLFKDFLDIDNENLRLKKLLAASESNSSYLKGEVSKIAPLETDLKAEQELTRTLTEKLHNIDVAKYTSVEELKNLKNVAESLEQNLKNTEALLRLTSQTNETQDKDITKLKKSLDTLTAQKKDIQTKYNNLEGSFKKELKKSEEADETLKGLRAALAEEKNLNVQKQQVIIELNQKLLMPTSKLYSGKSKEAEYKLPLFKENLRKKSLGTRPPTMLKFKA